MKYLADLPAATPPGPTTTRCTAAAEFASRHPEFVIEQPAWSFNESELKSNITHSPSGFLRRIS